MNGTPHCSFRVDFIEDGHRVFRINIIWILLPRPLDDSLTRIPYHWRLLSHLSRDGVERESEASTLPVVEEFEQSETGQGGPGRVVQGVRHLAGGNI